MKVNKSKISELPEYQKYSRIRISGNIIEYRGYDYMPKDMPIKKLDNYEYAIKSSGEICQFDRTDNRENNMHSLAVSMGNARAIINANFQGGINEIWLTLTYRDNMQDTKQLYIDFKNFMLKFKYAVDRQSVDYIAIAEPQKRGAWHLHCLIKLKEKKRLYLEQEKLLLMWGHGGVNVKRLKGIDNIGAYISAYCSNLPSNDENSKSYKKRERLKLYPRGFNFYRTSKDIIRPQWINADAGQKEKLRSMKPEFSQGIEIVDDDGNKLQRIVYKQYNIIRK